MKYFLTIILSFLFLFSHAQNNAIFYGGVGDGWEGESYLQASNQTMFRGDTNDGWNVNNYAQPGNDFVYFGGQGDGWATNFLALSPLPLDLLSFTGHDQNGQHVLDWVTTNEVNTSYFNVEHSRTTQQFKEIGLVSSKGNSANEVSYQFINNEPQVGPNYYRLKIVDNDQRFKYSNVILLMLASDNSSVLVYPNPTVSELNISIVSNNKLSAKVSLYDMNGKIIYKDTHYKNKFSLNIANYANGMYQLVIEKGTERSAIKFQKQ